MKDCNEENEKRMNGKTKLKIRKNIAKTMMIENVLKNKREAIQFSKSTMQAINQGKQYLSLKEEEEADYDNRLFADFIIKHGLTSPRKKKYTWKDKARAYYNEILDSIPETTYNESRFFLANLKFQEYITKNYPNEKDDILNILDNQKLTASEYYDTLLSLGLTFREMELILKLKEVHFHNLLITNPETKEKVLLHNCSIMTVRKNDEQLLSLEIFEDETFNQTPILERLKTESETPAPSITEFDSMTKCESFIISINKIETMMKNAITDSNQTFNLYSDNTNKGRKPNIFEIRIKNDCLQIRQHKTGTYPLTFQPFTIWATENLSMLETINNRIAKIS